MSKKTLFALTIAAFMTGCATLPSPEVMRAETQSYSLPRLPEKDKAIIYVVRPSSLGTFIRFNVFLNDQEANSEMGFTRGTQYIYFNVNPGKHKIYSKAENWAETDVDAKSGDIIFIQQEPAMGVIMARNNIFKIDELQGKYNVKTLTPGTILKSEK